MVSPWYYESFHGWFYYHTERNTCHSMHTGTIYRLYESSHDWFYYLTERNSRHSMNIPWYEYYSFMCGFMTGRRETLVTVCTLVYGFSLVWIIFSCLVLPHDVEKLLSQYAHWYGFSLVWITLSCLVLLLDKEKVLSHMHIGMFFPLYESFHDRFYDVTSRNSCYNMHIGIVWIPLGMIKGNESLFLAPFSQNCNASFLSQPHNNWISGCRVMKNLSMLKTI